MSNVITTFFKLRHIPTQMFYQPVRGRFTKDKNNLSKGGKVYHKKPSLSYIEHGYVQKGVFNKTKESEWEIVEYQVTEIKHVVNPNAT